MRIHEYQAKEILKKYGVPVPEGHVCYNGETAWGWAKSLGVGSCAVKAQIHAGGRGRAGGVQFGKDPVEVRELTWEMLGSTLVTNQTGPQGKAVGKVLIERAYEHAEEYYVAIFVDRAKAKVTIIASTEGGCNIEEAAAKFPEKIHRQTIDPFIGFSAFQGRKLAFKLGLKGKAVSAAVKFFAGLYDVFLAKDCTLLEINPMALTKEGTFVALDAKVIVDDTALFRHPELRDLRDYNEEDPREVEASRNQISYIPLEGNIGCLVNGAGMAMATMDIIKLYGGAPANFLDVGGGASKEKVAGALKIILSDENVKGIMVNIFGGIMKCDLIATALVEAARDIGIEVPLVVRLEGTNVEQGRKILAESGISIISAEGMADGARKIVKAVQEVSL